METYEGSSSQNDENLETMNHLIKELADDYSNYFVIDTTKVVEKFDDSIESNLVLLEDFCGILDVIRNENSASVEQLVPIIVEKSKEMEVLYSKIDQLDIFVKLIKDQVDKMETELTKAEQSFASENKVKKFITSLLMNNSSKKTPLTSNNPNKLSFGFTDIFKTQDYVSHPCDDY